ncbi:endolysin [Arthrobacter phage Altadena]|uniref:Endolysin n=1 Tax=Arthrobacter phage Altadena TaxID=3059064 RepID=A0AA96HVI9_9CAUD|nr:endolysin [Arthrobacter phage Altadena]
MTFMDPFPRGTRISQEFRASPGGYNPPGGHTGRDYAVPIGTPVRAAADGVIRNSDWLTDNYAANPWWLTRYGGDTLVLDCFDAAGRTDTMPTFVYAHLKESTAPVGKRVKKGEIIGYSGNSGTATTGPHCHVERLNPRYNLHDDVYGRAPLNFDEFYVPPAPAKPAPKPVPAKPAAPVRVVRVVSSPTVNERRGSSHLSTRLRQFHKGDKLTFKGYKIGTDPYGDGNNVWFIGAFSSTCFHSGGFVGGKNTAGLPRL